METFASWAALIAYLDMHNDIAYYKAPLDRDPVMVCVLKRFKNGKLRIARGPYAFTVDRGHLDRFRRKVV